MLGVHISKKTAKPVTRVVFKDSRLRLAGGYMSAAGTGRVTEDWEPLRRGGVGCIPELWPLGVVVK